jgi:pimeloyl-ACP methyl ester carboxylesterase
VLFDARGHGVHAKDSPGHGFEYRGQLTDDLRLLVNHIRVVLAPGAKIHFVGHSSAGGVAFVLAADRDEQLFDSYIAITRMLGLQDELNHQSAVTTFAFPNIPRIIALTLLDKLQLQRFTTVLHRSLPVLCFVKYPKTIAFHHDWCVSYLTVQEHAPFALAYNYQSLIPSIEQSRRILVIVADKDEHMKDPEPLLKPLKASLNFKHIADATHMSVLSHPETAKTIASFIHTH